MVTRYVENEFGRDLLVTFIMRQEMPFIAEIQPGKRRSVAQNRLQRKWLTEVSEQMGDRTPEEVRGFCKLHFGVPIMRSANEDFQHTYDERIRPLSYETKIALMMVPLDLPVTRLMTTKQNTQYLDEIYRHFTGEGIALTAPDDQRYAMESAR